MDGDFIADDCVWVGEQGGGWLDDVDVVMVGVC